MTARHEARRFDWESTMNAAADAPGASPLRLADGRPWPAMSIAEAHALMTAPGSMFEIGEAEIRGVKLKIWKNAPPHLGIIFDLGQQFAARTYNVYENQRVSFDQHRAAALRLARHLQTEGVRKGDRVAIIMRNIPEWSVAFWASVLIGAIATPLNAWWTGPELEYGLQDSGAKIAIMDHERWERVREHVDACPDLQKVLVARATEEIADPRVAKLEHVLGEIESWPGTAPGGEATPDAGIQPDDDATIFYTSGTTGKPKGAVITHRNIVSNFINSSSAQARAYLRRGEQPPAPDPNAPQKAFLVSVPLFHATGCFAIMIPAMFQGFKLVFQRRWDVEQALPLMEKERITHFGGVPTIAWQVIEHPR
jgi:long-chain acyl-CoA synthetase